MLSYFRETDIFRFVALFFLCLAIRFFYLTADVSIIPSVRWLSIGEIMGSSSILYRDIWTTLEPFSASVYMIVVTLFGKSFVSLRFLSMLLVFAQALLFNYYANKSQVFSERTAYPALFYLLFASTNYDFFTLSPILMGLTFLLPVLNILFIDVRIGDKPNNHFLAGLFLGIASLFYLPYMLMLPLTVLCFIAFSNFDFTRVFQLVFAFLFPWAVVSAYYYFQSGLWEMVQQLLVGYIGSERIIYIDYNVFLQHSAPLVLLGAMSFFYTTTVSNLLNYQYSSIKIMIFWFFTAILSIYFMNEWSYYSTIPMIPCFAFVATHFYISIRKRWMAEVAFLTMILMFGFIHYNTFSLDIKRAAHSSSSILTYTNQPIRFDGDKVENKTVLVLGKNHLPYLHNRRHPVYADWNLAKKDFTHLNQYRHISNVYSKLSLYPPDFIVDEVQLMPVLFIKIPEWKNLYTPSLDQKMYKRKEM
ncbi:MAG: DUF6427 family protein [Cytophagaceae bacterium]|nr:DUF6427 family protein [Cytophagaceae bacterium]